MLYGKTSIIYTTCASDAQAHAFADPWHMLVLYYTGGQTSLFVVISLAYQ
jgi:hypothetical protein